MQRSAMQEKPGDVALAMDKEWTVSSADSPAKIRECHPVMVQLRPHLELDAFVQRVTDQMVGGYKLIYIGAEGGVAAVAGYRIMQNLAWGKFLYVDDLVTDEAHRSLGLGAILFDFLLRTAQDNRCAEMHLDSGVQRFGAHRFYLSKRMDITSHHFAIRVPPADE